MTCPLWLHRAALAFILGALPFALWLAVVK